MPQQKILVEIVLERNDGPRCEPEDIALSINDMMVGENVEVQNPEREDMTTYSIDEINLTE